MQRKRSTVSTVARGLTKSPSSDDAEGYTPQRFKKGHAHTNPKRTVCSLFDFETTASKPQPPDELGDSNQQASVLTVLKDISTTLNDLVDRVQSTEKEIKSVKKKFKSGSVDSSASKAQICILNLSIKAYL